jgi:hypothetical protein
MPSKHPKWSSQNYSVPIDVAAYGGGLCIAIILIVALIAAW